jgi:hypothetical protein
MSGRLCRYLGGFCALTLVWGAAVAAVIAARIADQVAASQDLARDIAALDGGGHAIVARWQDIVGLMLQYRGTVLFELMLLPPLGLFATVLLYQLWRRRRPAQPLRPVYSAALRRVAPSRFM